MRAKHKDMNLNTHQGLSKNTNINQDNHQQIESEATKDLQSTQEVLMFMLTRTRSTTVNTNTTYQVTKKMPQQTFHQDHK